MTLLTKLIHHYNLNTEKKKSNDKINIFKSEQQFRIRLKHRPGIRHNYTETSSNKPKKINLFLMQGNLVTSK